jgi:hypothetical protein
MPGFVNYKKGCTRLTTASDKVYQLLAHGRWFSQGIPVSSTTKTGRHDIVEIWLKVGSNTINEWINQMITHVPVILIVSPITSLIWMQSDKEHFQKICWIKIMHIRHKLLNIELYMIDWLIVWHLPSSISWKVNVHNKLRMSDPEFGNHLVLLEDKFLSCSIIYCKCNIKWHSVSKCLLNNGVSIFKSMLSTYPEMRCYLLICISKNS